MAGPQTPMSYTVTHLGGRRFASQIRTHTVVTDQSVRAGGEDSAPSPLELVSAALGSCIAVYVHQFCESRGLPQSIRDEHPDAIHTIPIMSPHVRSLNLANAVAIVLYEGLRQLGAV